MSSRTNAIAAIGTLISLGILIAYLTDRNDSRHSHLSDPFAENPGEISRQQIHSEREMLIEIDRVKELLNGTWKSHDGKHFASIDRDGKFAFQLGPYKSEDQGTFISGYDIDLFQSEFQHNGVTHGFGLFPAYDLVGNPERFVGVAIVENPHQTNTETPIDPFTETNLGTSRNSEKIVFETQLSR